MSLCIYVMFMNGLKRCYRCKCCSIARNEISCKQLIFVNECSNYNECSVELIFYMNVIFHS